MFDVAIYTKTAKGRAEMTGRTLGLAPRLRQALIMIDGKTPYGQLKELLVPLGDPGELVQQLAQMELIISDYDLPPMPEFPGITSEVATTTEDVHPTR